MAKGPPRTHAEALANLAEQRSFIRKSAEAYDAGDIAEAKRISTAAYVLLNDGNNSASILSQLGMKSILMFADSARDKNGWPMITLVLVNVPAGGGDPSFMPYCQIPGPPSSTMPWLTAVKFEDWWKRVIFIQNDGTTLTRGGLIFSMRSTDGGAHYDPDWTAKNIYPAIATKGDPTFRFEGSSFIYGNSPRGEPLSNAHLACMRQIGWEIEETFRSVNFA
jgi:hypothetical protein